MSDTVTTSNKTPFDEDNYKVWYCDLSWTGSAGDISVSGIPFTSVYLALLVPTGGTWATAPTWTDTDKLTTAGTVSFGGTPTSGATTARLYVWGWGP